MQEKETELKIKGQYLRDTILSDNTNPLLGPFHTHHISLAGAYMFEPHLGPWLDYQRRQHHHHHHHHHPHHHMMILIIVITGTA